MAVWPVIIDTAVTQTYYIFKHQYISISDRQCLRFSMSLLSLYPVYSVYSYTFSQSRTRAKDQLRVQTCEECCVRFMCTMSFIFSGVSGVYRITGLILACALSPSRGTVCDCSSAVELYFKKQPHCC